MRITSLSFLSNLSMKLVRLTRNSQLDMNMSNQELRSAVCKPTRAVWGKPGRSVYIPGMGQDGTGALVSRSLALLGKVRALEIIHTNSSEENAWQHVLLKTEDQKLRLQYILSLLFFSFHFIFL